MVETPEAKWARSRQLLRAREYGAAWPLFEARKSLPWIDVWRPITDAPEWTGEDLSGKKIVVCAEQGYGDQLMFGRYLGLLRERAASILIACDPRALGRLFEAAGYPTRAFWSDRPIPASDYWISFGSLPFVLGAEQPPAPRYLPLLRSSGDGVGVMCTGSAKHANDATRSVRGEAGDRLRSFGRDLDPVATGARDFLETAEIVAGLDLVVTVDTAMAHLAGALGTPCWVLLPREGLDWRWNDGVHSDWYPSFRLFRQASRGEWRSVISEVEAALREQGRRGDIEDHATVASGRRGG